MNKLKVIERNNHRVLTTSQVAESYETDAKTVSKNFTRNKDRYEEGVHFFILQGDDLKQFKTDHQIDDQFKHAHTLYLWTKKGVFLHAKSLNTDKAWEAYSNLVDDYFNKVEIIQHQQTELPNTLEDVLILALGSMKEMKNEIAELRKKDEQKDTEMKELRLVVDNEVWITDHQRADIKEAIGKRVGYLKSQFIDAHFQSLYTALNSYFNVPKYEKIRRTDFQQAIEFINGWFPKKKEETASH